MLGRQELLLEEGGNESCVDQCPLCLGLGLFWFLAPSEELGHGPAGSSAPGGRYGGGVHRRGPWRGHMVPDDLVLDILVQNIERRQQTALRQVAQVVNLSRRHHS